MLDKIKGLVKNKEEIVREETKTVKMIVPFSFDLVDGKCVDEGVQGLYDFLDSRDDVIKENEEVENKELTEQPDSIEELEDWQKNQL